MQLLDSPLGSSCTRQSDWWFLSGLEFIWFNLSNYIWSKPSFQGAFLECWSFTSRTWSHLSHHDAHMFALISLDLLVWFKWMKKQAKGCQGDSSIIVCWARKIQCTAWITFNLFWLHSLYSLSSRIACHAYDDWLSIPFLALSNLTLDIASCLPLLTIWYCLFCFNLMLTYLMIHKVWQRGSIVRWIHWDSNQSIWRVVLLRLQVNNTSLRIFETWLHQVWVSRKRTISGLDKPDSLHRDRKIESSRSNKFSTVSNSAIWPPSITRIRS